MKPKQKKSKKSTAKRLLEFTGRWAGEPPSEQACNWGYTGITDFEKELAHLILAEIEMIIMMHRYDFTTPCITKEDLERRRDWWNEHWNDFVKGRNSFLNRWRIDEKAN